jgi:hypothetical protein
MTNFGPDLEKKIKSEGWTFLHALADEEITNQTEFKKKYKDNTFIDEITDGRMYNLAFANTLLSEKHFGKTRTRYDCYFDALGLLDLAYRGHESKEDHSLDRKFDDREIKTLTKETVEKLVERFEKDEDLTKECVKLHWEAKKMELCMKVEQIYLLVKYGP